MEVAMRAAQHGAAFALLSELGRGPSVLERDRNNRLAVVAGCQRNSRFNLARSDRDHGQRDEVKAQRRWTYLAPSRGYSFVSCADLRTTYGQLRLSGVLVEEDQTSG